MKKFYQTPSLEVVDLGRANVIVTSNGGDFETDPTIDDDPYAAPRRESVIWDWKHSSSKSDSAFSLM